MTSILSREQRVDIFNKISDIFNKNIELENVLMPKLNEYDQLISGYHFLNSELGKLINLIDTTDETDFAITIKGMAFSMIDVNFKSIEHWEKLKEKAFGTNKYSFFQNHKDVNEIARLVKERKVWGARMNAIIL